MGVATFAIGLLPTAEQIGVWAPVLLVTMRVLQGFALGGEYGGAAIYVAEHAHPKRRGAATGWIQSSAVDRPDRRAWRRVGHARDRWAKKRSAHGAGASPSWSRSACSAISVWIRLQLEESPAFKKLQDEGKVSKRAYAESFFEWRNLKIVLLALFGVMMAQGVVWYTAHFYSQFYLERILKID